MLIIYVTHSLFTHYYTYYHWKKLQ